MKKYPSLFPGILACLIISGASGSEYPAARGPAAGGPQAVLRGPVFSGQPAVAAAADYGRMPIHFIANGGQLDTAVDFYIPGSDKSVYFSRRRLDHRHGRTTRRAERGWRGHSDSLGEGEHAAPRQRASIG